MNPHRRRARVRRDAVRDATARQNYRALAAAFATPPRKPPLTNGQVRRFARRELTGAAA